MNARLAARLLGLATIAATSAWLSRGMQAAAQRSAAPAAASSSRAPLPPGFGSPGRCEALRGEYERAWAAASACDEGDVCVVEARGGVYSGLDGCSRAGNRAAPWAPADRAAGAWLEAGCAGEYRLCPPPLEAGFCREGACSPSAPPPLPRDWRRVEFAETFTLTLPPDAVEVPFRRICGNGPDQRIFRAPGYTLRVEMGDERTPILSPSEQPRTWADDRPVLRQLVQIGPYPALLARFEQALVASKELAPDGSWPRYEAVLALEVDHVPFATRTNPYRAPSSADGVTIVVDCEPPRRACAPAARILDSLSFF